MSLRHAFRGVDAVAATAVAVDDDHDADAHATATSSDPASAATTPPASAATPNPAVLVHQSPTEAFQATHQRPLAETRVPAHRYGPVQVCASDALLLMTTSKLFTLAPVADGT